MSNSRDIDAAEQLRRLVIRGIVEQTGLNEEHAMPYATAVLTVLQPSMAVSDCTFPRRPCRTSRVHAWRQFAPSLPRDKTGDWFAAGTGYRGLLCIACSLVDCLNRRKRAENSGPVSPSVKD